MFYLTYVFLQRVLLTRFWTIWVVIVWIKLIVMSPCRTGFHINGPKNGGHILQVLQWVVFSLAVVAKLCFNFHLHGKYFVVQRVH